MIYPNYIAVKRMHVCISCMSSAWFPNITKCSNHGNVWRGKDPIWLDDVIAKEMKLHYRTVALVLAATIVTTMRMLV